MNEIRTRIPTKIQYNSTILYNNPSFFTFELYTHSTIQFNFSLFFYSYRQPRVLTIEEDVGDVMPHRGKKCSEIRSSMPLEVRVGRKVQSFHINMFRFTWFKTYGKRQLGMSPLCSQNPEKLLPRMPKSCQKIAKIQKVAT